MSSIIDKKINDKIHRNQKLQKLIQKETKKNFQYLENEPDGYIIIENENEKTLKVTQDYLKSTLPKYNSDNIFDLSLPSNGPFYIDYTRNGKYLLMGGEKGNVIILDWKLKNIIVDFNVNSKISNVKFLQNDSMISIAQDDMLYIYDKQGIELHSLDYMQQPQFLEYLPYHRQTA